MEENMEMMMMMMPMCFWKGTDLTWLIHGVESSNSGQYFAGLLVTFLIAFTVESLTYARNRLYINSQIEAIKKTQELNRYVTFAATSEDKTHYFSNDNDY
mgnify:CR=1 FL=1